MNRNGDDIFLILTEPALLGAALTDGERLREYYSQAKLAVALVPSLAGLASEQDSPYFGIVWHLYPDRKDKESVLFMTPLNTFAGAEHSKTVFEELFATKSADADLVHVGTDGGVAVQIAKKDRVYGIVGMNMPQAVIEASVLLIAVRMGDLTGVEALALARQGADGCESKLEQLLKFVGQRAG